MKMYHKIGQLANLTLQVCGWQYRFRTDGRVTGVKIGGGGWVIGTFKICEWKKPKALDLQREERL